MDIDQIIVRVLEGETDLYAEIIQHLLVAGSQSPAEAGKRGSFFQEGLSDGGNGSSHGFPLEQG